jgi:hypothetical protein
VARRRERRKKKAPPKGCVKVDLPDRDTKKASEKFKFPVTKEKGEQFPPQPGAQLRE